MKLIKQVGPTCLVTSFAMVLEVQPKELIIEIGHDGTDEWWPGEMRGHHIAELIDCCLRRGRAVTFIDPNPVTSPYEDERDEKPILDVFSAQERFRNHLANSIGVITTDAHAVAWDGKQVLDPIGFTGSIKDYVPLYYWMVNQIIP